MPEPTDDTTDTTPPGDNNHEPQDNAPEHEPTGSDDPTDEDRKPDRTFTQADLDRLVADRVARERRKYVDYDDLKRKATELDKRTAAEKTELEKLNDQLTAAQVELQGLRVADIRRKAAHDAGLDPDLTEFITAADPDAAADQAARLAERLKNRQQPKADLKQGPRQQQPKPESRDDFIRRMAGYPT